MDKYATYLDLGTTRIEEQELDLFPFLDPTLQYSSTPTLLIYTRYHIMAGPSMSKITSAAFLA